MPAETGIWKGEILVATNMNRIMISVPADIEQEIEQLKKTRFYDKPYAEVYRTLLRMGLEKLAEEGEKEEK